MHMADHARVARVTSTWRATAPFINAFLGVVGTAYFSFAVARWFLGPEDDVELYGSPRALEFSLLALSFVAAFLLAISAVAMRSSHPRGLLFVKATAVIGIVWAVCIAVQDWRYAALTESLRFLVSELLKDSTMLAVFGAYALSQMWWTPASEFARPHTRDAMVRLVVAINLMIGVMFAIALVLEIIYFWRDRHQIIEDAAQLYGKDYDILTMAYRSAVVASLAIVLLLVSSWYLLRGKNWARWGTSAAVLFFLFNTLRFPGLLVYSLANSVDSFVEYRDLSRLLFGLRCALLPAYLPVVIILLLWLGRPNQVQHVRDIHVKKTIADGL